MIKIKNDLSANLLGYALIWFLVNDRIKLIAYNIFDPVKTGKPDEYNIQQT